MITSVTASDLRTAWNWTIANGGTVYDVGNGQYLASREPRDDLRVVTLEEIDAATAAPSADDGQAWEANTTGAMVNGKPVTIAELRRAFDKVCNPHNWKAPWAAAVPHQLVSLVVEAVKFFHADAPTLAGIERLTGRVLMEGKGYQAY